MFPRVDKGKSDELAKLESLLQEVEESFILTEEGGHEVRSIPTFRPEEISLGKVLGTGGFGIVQEIRKFTLDDEISSDRGDNSVDDGSAEHETLSNGSFAEHDEDTHRAKRLMQHRVKRDGHSRYALKRLLGCLNKRELARGVIDIALEAKYLQILSHPSIGKRKLGAMKLYDTLDKRMRKWSKIETGSKGYLLGFGKKKRVLKALLVKRMTVAYDLASAFYYLHQHQIVYRDIKPENIGFDVRDEVKVFDFGLCKSLMPKLKAEGYGYRLTGQAGSLPYMAPEVVKMDTYDTKCDVFGFAILLWEILTLRPSFFGMTPSKYVENVVINKFREAVPKSAPPLTRVMLPEAWNDDPRKRPEMRRVAYCIRQDLNDMTTDDTVLHRTKHLVDRSNHSVQMDASSSLRLGELLDLLDVETGKLEDGPACPHPLEPAALEKTANEISHRHLATAIATYSS